MRSPVDIVVPFAGTDHALRELVARLAGLERTPADTLTIVDNRPPSASRRPDLGPLPEGARVVQASEVASSYYARNAGAELGHNPWIVFLDDDVRPVADLVDRYLGDPAAAEADLLIGEIVDVASGSTPTLVERYSIDRRALGATGRDPGPFAYAQTANAAVRRSAFERVGGFRDDLWSGGDADFSFRVAQTGGALRRVASASVEHQSRADLRSLVRQYTRYGAGSEWLEAEYPGFFPRLGWRGWARLLAVQAAHIALALVRRQADEAAFRVIDVVKFGAMERGRRLTNVVARTQAAPQTRS